MDEIAAFLTTVRTLPGAIVTESGSGLFYKAEIRINPRLCDALRALARFFNILEIESRHREDGTVLYACEPRKNYILRVRQGAGQPQESA